MTKMTAEHLSGGAFVYIRQSTADQLKHNQESRRRQYGWPSVPDSLVGAQSRSSGMIWAVQEAASIARASTSSGGDLRGPRWLRRTRDRGVAGWPCNGRDWHTLIEFCNGLVRTVIGQMRMESMIAPSQ